MLIVPVHRKISLRYFPALTFGLIFVNVVVFLFWQLTDPGFTERNHLDFVDPQWHQWLSHMFLHGSLGHLLGNMLFLGLLGVLVEPALRPGQFVLFYVATGLAAAGASLLVRADVSSGLVGASGAIAGLMGMFTTLFGRRPVRFFYWIFVYFDYVKAPALWLLPAWLGWELVQLFLVESNVAYEAHAAGLAAGAMIGYAVTRWGEPERGFLDGDDTQEEAPRYADLRPAQAALKALDVDEAVRLLDRALLICPEDVEARLLLYRVTRLNPTQARFHQAAAWLLTDIHVDPQTVRETWSDYQAATGGRIRLGTGVLLRLAGRLLDLGEQQGARRIAQLLRRNAPETTGLAALLTRVDAATPVARGPRRD